MGLESDTLAATTAAAELEDATRKQVTAVDDLDRLIDVGRSQLTTVVEDGETSLRNLQTLLTTMELALSQGFTRLNESTEGLDDRVRGLRKNVVAELDANEVAINGLLPIVQDALTMVEKTIKDAEGKLQALNAEDARLVALAEQKAHDAESRAQAMLTTVQGQRQDLESKSSALTGSWNTLAGQLDSQLSNLQTAFEAANGAATTALQGLLEHFSTGASQTSAGVRATLVDATAEEMTRLSTELGQHLVELQALGKRPRQLVEEDLMALSKKLNDITEPLRNIDRIHQKARSLELFDF